MVLSGLHQDRDFYRQLIRLGLPILVQNLINQSLALVDTFMMGMVGTDELAGVTLANTPFFVIMLMVFGFQSGSSVLFSQYWGRGDRTAINRVMGIGLYAAGAITLVMSIVLAIFPDQVMSLTTNDPVLVEIAARYGRIVGFSYFLNSFSLIYIAAQRSMENPKFGTYVLSISMASNTFFNWVFIFGNLGFPAMGVEGAALGTLCARVVEVTVTMAYAVRNRKFRLEWSALLRPGKIIIQDFFRYSAPVVLNETLWGFGTSLYPVIIGHLENAAVAVSAYTLAGNIERIAAIYMMAVSMATAVMVGKHVGAGRVKQAQDTGHAMLSVSVLCGIVIGLVLLALNFLVLTPYVLPLFQIRREALPLVTSLLCWTSIALPFRSYNNTAVVGVLRGGGDVRTAMMLDLTPLYCVGIPAAALVGLVFHQNVVWVYAAICIEESVKGILGYMRIRSNRWIRNLTRPGEELKGD